MAESAGLDVGGKESPEVDACSSLPYGQSIGKQEDTFYQRTDTVNTSLEFFDAAIVYAPDDHELACETQTNFLTLKLKNGKTPKICLYDDERFVGSKTRLPRELLKRCSLILILLTENFNGDKCVDFLTEQLIGETRLCDGIEVWKEYSVRLLYTQPKNHCNYRHPTGMAAVRTYNVFDWHDKLHHQKYMVRLLDEYRFQYSHRFSSEKEITALQKTEQEKVDPGQNSDMTSSLTGEEMLSEIDLVNDYFTARLTSAQTVACDGHQTKLVQQQNPLTGLKEAKSATDTEAQCGSPRISANPEAAAEILDKAPRLNMKEETTIEGINKTYPNEFESRQVGPIGKQDDHTESEEDIDAPDPDSKCSLVKKPEFCAISESFTETNFKHVVKPNSKSQSDDKGEYNSSTCGEYDSESIKGSLLFGIQQNEELAVKAGKDYEIPAEYLQGDQEDQDQCWGETIVEKIGTKGKSDVKVDGKTPGKEKETLGHKDQMEEEADKYSESNTDQKNNEKFKENIKETEKNRNDREGETMKKVMDGEATESKKDTEGNNKDKEGNNKDTEGNGKDREWNNKNTEGNNKDTEGNNRDKEGNNKDTEGNNKDTEGNNRDKEGNNKDTEGNNKDTEGNNKDTEGNNRNTEGNNKDTEGNNKDTEGNNKNTDGNNKDTEGNNKDKEGNNKDTEGNNKNTEGNNKDTEGNNKDKEGNNKDTEGNNKDTEGNNKEARFGMDVDDCKSDENMEEKRRNSYRELVSPAADSSLPSDVSLDQPPHQGTSSTPKLYRDALASAPYSKQAISQDSKDAMALVPVSDQTINLVNSCTDTVAQKEVLYRQYGRMIEHSRRQGTPSTPKEDKEILMFASKQMTLENGLIPYFGSSYHFGPAYDKQQGLHLSPTTEYTRSDYQEYAESSKTRHGKNSSFKAASRSESKSDADTQTAPEPAPAPAVTTTIVNIYGSTGIKIDGGNNVRTNMAPTTPPQPKQEKQQSKPPTNNKSMLTYPTSRPSSSDRSRQQGFEQDFSQDSSENSGPELDWLPPHRQRRAQSSTVKIQDQLSSDPDRPTSSKHETCIEDKPEQSEEQAGIVSSRPEGHPSTLDSDEPHNPQGDRGSQPESGQIACTPLKKTSRRSRLRRSVSWLSCGLLPYSGKRNIEPRLPR